MSSSLRSWIAPFLVLAARRLARRCGAVLLVRGRCSFEVAASQLALELSCSHFGLPGRWVLAEKSSEACRVPYEHHPELASLGLKIQEVIAIL